MLFRSDEIVDLRGFISLKGLKALGNRLSSLPVTEVLLEPANEDLENAVALEVMEARKADEMREKSSQNTSTEDSTPPEEDSTSSEDSTPEDFGENGQSTLF